MKKTLPGRKTKMRKSSTNIHSVKNQVWDQHELKSFFIVRGQTTRLVREQLGFLRGSNPPIEALIPPISNQIKECLLEVA